MNFGLTEARHIMNMDVYWLEQTESDVPPGNEWLSGNEIIVLEGLHVAAETRRWARIARSSTWR